MVKNPKPPESAKRKRSSDHGDEMQKRMCPESISLAEDGFSRFEEKLKLMIEECTSKLFAEIKLCEQHPDPKPEAPKQKNKPSGEEGEAKGPKSFDIFIEPQLHWWQELVMQTQWLADTHMDAITYMFRQRMKLHPEWFRRDRICFADSGLSMLWTRDKYERFKNSVPDKHGLGS
ncbi:unnamed protein product [Microthlaspi erraticum]|uniref:Uncharacterized protein n=1 Tax=Microthlaspi erraticum TaxID=1685480 RepID=A0A6D2HEN7_9BRAS|nr:unnamed protein product [Microthlaspi erraticum]